MKSGVKISAKQAKSCQSAAASSTTVVLYAGRLRIAIMCCRRGSFVQHCTGGKTTSTGNSVILAKSRALQEKEKEDDEGGR